MKIILILAICFLKLTVSAQTNLIIVQDKFCWETNGIMSDGTNIVGGRIDVTASEPLPLICNNVYGSLNTIPNAIYYDTNGIISIATNIVGGTLIIGADVSGDLSTNWVTDGSTCNLTYPPSYDDHQTGTILTNTYADLYWNEKKVRRLLDSERVGSVERTVEHY